ncbi:MAG: HAD family hydrolase [Spirochaetaceae bacterium]|nr:MAG: HAD family hydrolase [Spirochaetaceae bacterium]
MITHIGLNIDGVLLKDTFSPVLKAVFEKLGFDYTPEIERQLFSQNQNKAAGFIQEKYKLSLSKEELIALYFKERNQYLNSVGNMINAGVDSLLSFLKTLKVSVFSYGGLPEDYFKKEMGEFYPYFAEYICTNDFRPGLKEIIRDVYKTEARSVLFVDDVNTVAETAKCLNCPFIGIPSTPFQRADMIKTGVKHILDSVSQINLQLLNEIEKEIADERIWQ